MLFPHLLACTHMLFSGLDWLAKWTTNKAVTWLLKMVLGGKPGWRDVLLTSSNGEVCQSGKMHQQNYPQRPVFPEGSLINGHRAFWIHDQPTVCDRRWFTSLVKWVTADLPSGVISPVQLSNSIHKAPSSRARAEAPKWAPPQTLAQSQTDPDRSCKVSWAPDSLPHHSAVSGVGGQMKLQGPRHFALVDHCGKQNRLVNSIQESAGGKHTCVCWGEDRGSWRL